MSPAPPPGIPWYVHPAADPDAWSRLGARFRDADGIADGFVVLNVDSGPGGEDDSYYPAAVERLRRAAPRLSLLGYVDLDYGARPPATVLAEAEAWRRRYGIEGLMLDRFPSGRAPGTAAEAETALAAVALLRAAGLGPVVGNPGVVPVPELAEALDVVCEFEGTGGDYLERGPVLGAAPARWHLVHSCTPAQLRAAVDIAAGTGVGHVFCTDGTPPHPWNGFPAPAAL